MSCSSYPSSVDYGDNNQEARHAGQDTTNDRDAFASVFDSPARVLSAARRALGLVGRDRRSGRRRAYHAERRFVVATFSSARSMR